MGLSMPHIHLLAEMKKKGDFDSIRSIFELGSQNLHLAGCEQDFQSFLEFMGANATEDQVKAWVAGSVKTSNLYEALGLEYRALDVLPGKGTVQFDLNHQSLPDENRSKYDLVTNFGTTEHLMNQTNAFKTMHDACKPGGYMIHAVPCFGYTGHCFFNYHPQFFQDLANANGYEMLGMWVTFFHDAFTLIPYVPGIIENLEVQKGSGVTLSVMMKKKRDADFAIPLQGNADLLIPPKPFDRLYQYTIGGKQIMGDELPAWLLENKNLILGKYRFRQLAMYTLRRLVRMISR